MEFYEVVKSRRTIRNFTNKKVDKKIIERILSAGLMAPTNDHLRNWEFVVVTEKELIEKIIIPIKNLFPDKKEVDFAIKSWKVDAPLQKEMYEDALPKQYKMLIQSECLILPFFKQEPSLLEPKNLSDLNGFASIWCCLENIMLAATAENLGYAMKIPFQHETKHIFETLQHPKEYFMPCYLAIGHPLSDTKNPKQIKQKIEEKIHYNKW